MIYHLHGPLLSSGNPPHFAPALTTDFFTKAMESLTRKLCKEGSCTFLHRYGCTHTMAQQHWVRGKSNFRRNFAQELQSFVVPLCGEEWVVMDDGDNGNDTENADDKDEAEGSWRQSQRSWIYISKINTSTRHTTKIVENWAHHIRYLPTWQGHVVKSKSCITCHHRFITLGPSGLLVETVHCLYIFNTVLTEWAIIVSMLNLPFAGQGLSSSVACSHTGAIGDQLRLHSCRRDLLLNFQVHWLVLFNSSPPNIAMAICWWSCHIVLLMGFSQITRHHIYRHAQITSNSRLHEGV